MDNMDNMATVTLDKVSFDSREDCTLWKVFLMYWDMGLLLPHDNWSLYFLLQMMEVC